MVEVLQCGIGIPIWVIWRQRSARLGSSWTTSTSPPPMRTYAHDLSPFGKESVVMIYGFPMDGQ